MIESIIRNLSDLIIKDPNLIDKKIFELQNNLDRRAPGSHSGNTNQIAQTFSESAIQYYNSLPTVIKELQKIKEKIS